jgi:hypothetical protein
MAVAAAAATAATAAVVTACGHHVDEMRHDAAGRPDPGGMFITDAAC